MSTTAFPNAACTGMVRRPVLDVVAEKVARSLLAWTNRRAQIARPSHDRIALLRSNEQLRANALGGVARSPLAR